MIACGEVGLARGTPLSLDECEEISRGIAAGGDSGREIASRLGRHYSVVNREIARNSGRIAYRASDAHQQAAISAQRPKERKLERDPLLLDAVNAGLENKWSPRQIACRLRDDFPDDEAMWVSHETIYQALFVQAKGQLKARLVGRLGPGRAGQRLSGDLVPTWSTLHLAGRVQWSTRRVAGAGEPPPAPQAGLPTG